MSSIRASVWQGGSSLNPDRTAIAGSGMKGIGGKFANSVPGTLAFGAVMGGAGSAIGGGNFWQGAVTGLIVSGFNHIVHQIQLKSDIESKYPGLYKTLSKLKSYVKNHQSVLESMSKYSGFSNKKILSLLSIRNLADMVKVGGTDGDYGMFSREDPNNVHIREDIAKGIDSGGWKYEPFGISENVNGTSFFAGITVLHELVHYGRYWNGLSNRIGVFEAGQMFEKRVFGSVMSINGSTQNARIYDWKF